MRQESQHQKNLVYDVIKSTGPMGSFLKNQHTLNNMNLQYKPKYSETRHLNIWLNDKKMMFDRVRERVKKIEKIETPPLPKDVQERMEICSFAWLVSWFCCVCARFVCLVQCVGFKIL